MAGCSKRISIIDLCFTKGKEECNMKKEIFETPIAEVTKFDKEIRTLDTSFDDSQDWG